ncbi:hypothetical protein [Bosea sp. AS-1]|uniref:hypothetical protein n=1 Tax=Bosea sp. AS-1 TaxID=2015316 RepID=UPI000B77D6B5|nr:hypothetical protein [Bosea sp. AS-1]
MAKEQKRISIDAVLWDAVEAAARTKGIATNAYIEQALHLAIGPFDIIQKAADLSLAAQASAAETVERINVIADYIVDAHRANSKAG